MRLSMRCEGRLRTRSEPQGEDELLVPFVATEHLAIKALALLSHRRIAAMFSG
jgi:hypothetical protein